MSSEERLRADYAPMDAEPEPGTFTDSIVRSQFGKLERLSFDIVRRPGDRGSGSEPGAGGGVSVAVAATDASRPDQQPARAPRAARGLPQVARCDDLLPVTRVCLRPVAFDAIDTHPDALATTVRHRHVLVLERHQSPKYARWRAFSSLCTPSIRGLGGCLPSFLWRRQTTCGCCRGRREGSARRRSRPP